MSNVPSIRRALISGVTGQDGSYLAALLLKKGYEVVGTTRDAGRAEQNSLRALGIVDQVRLVSMLPDSYRSVLSAITAVKPDEIYNLSGQSSVGRSFEQPVETLESNCIGTLNFLEAIRFVDPGIRLYNAGSGECFGSAATEPADEETAFRPCSPYAMAKATAFWQVSIYREAYNLFACSGILFNHESALRPERFVTQKIIRAACAIAYGERDLLELGNLDILRDWGWAVEYVEAMWLMLQLDCPEDLVIATGHTYSLVEFVERAFACHGLNWKDYVVTDDSLTRPSEHRISRANPTRAQSSLGWQASVTMPNIVDRLTTAEMHRRKTGEIKPY